MKKVEEAITKVLREGFARIGEAEIARLPETLRPIARAAKEAAEKLKAKEA